jgi:hypothetical protein
VVDDRWIDARHFILRCAPGRKKSSRDIVKDKMRDEFFDEHWHVLWEALSYEVLDAAVSGTIRCMLALLCPPYPTLPYPTLPRWGNSTAEARPGHRSMRCAVGLGELRRARSSRDSSFGTVLQSNCVRTRTSRMQRTKSGTIASASRSEGIPDPDKLPAWRSSHPPDQILEVNSIQNCVHPGKAYR